MDQTMRERKKEFRKKMLEKRTAIPKELKKRKSREICDKILLSDVYRDAEVIFAYMPFRGEVDIIPVIEDAWKRGKRVAVPRVLGDTCMDFYYIHSLNDVESGTFHVMEPRAVCQAAHEEKPFILTPGSAFTRDGYRMGYGKGYYDRYLEKHSAITAGICYEEQFSLQMPVEETDQKLDMIFYA